MSDVILNYADDIEVRVHDGHKLTVEFTQQGPQGGPGAPGATGTVTPEMIALKDEAVVAKEGAVSARSAADNSKAAAAASASAAATSSTNAGVARTEAQTARTGAQAAVTEAEVARADAQIALAGSETARSDAHIARDKAKDWAEEAANVEVEPERFSAKHHALNAANSAADASDAAIAADASKAAAAASNAGAVTAATNAELARDEVFTALTGAETAQEAAELAQSGSELARSDSLAAVTAAEATIAVVDASATKAAEWAGQSEDIEVEADKFSAKHHAHKAKTSQAAALASAANADASAAISNTARVASEAARDAAQAARDAAQTARTAAEASSATSTTAKNEAVVSEANAAASAEAARLSAIEAALYDPTASLLKEENGADILDKPLFRDTIDAAPKIHDHSTAQITGLDVALGSKAPLNSPDLTGSPTAPTQASTDVSTKIATTAFVKAKVDELIGGADSAYDTFVELQALMEADASGLAELVTQLGTKAPLISPALTGAPTAPTPIAGDASTLLATTEFVAAAIADFTGVDHVHAVADVIGLQDLLGDIQADLNAKQPAGSYEPERTPILQEEAETGTATTIRGWSAARVRQAVLAVTNAIVVTKAAIGLGNADDTSDADKPVSIATQAALDAKISSADLPVGTFGKTLVATASATAARTALAYPAATGYEASGDAVDKLISLKILQGVIAKERKNNPTSTTPVGAVRLSDDPNTLVESGLYTSAIYGTGPHSNWSDPNLTDTSLAALVVSKLGSFVLQEIYIYFSVGDTLILRKRMSKNSSGTSWGNWVDHTPLATVLAADATALTSHTPYAWSPFRVGSAIKAAPVGTATQTALDAKQDALDLPAQAEAEAGSATAPRSWSAQRVRQAILAVTNTKLTAASNLSDVANAVTARSNLKIWTGTQAQYNALTKDASTIYLVT